LKPQSPLDSSNNPVNIETRYHTIPDVPTSDFFCGNYLKAWCDPDAESCKEEYGGQIRNNICAYSSTGQ